MAIVFKIIDTTLKQEEIKKMILVTIPSENFGFIKNVLESIKNSVYSSFRNVIFSVFICI